MESDTTHPPAPSQFRGMGRCLLADVTQGVARRLALPWAILGRPYGAAMCRTKRSLEPRWGSSPQRCGDAEVNTKFCGKKCGLLRESSDCYGLLRDVSRKFAQIRAVNPRLFGLLRVRPNF